MTASAYGYNEINMTAITYGYNQINMREMRMITMALTRHFPLINMRLHHSKFLWWQKDEHDSNGYNKINMSASADNYNTINLVTVRLIIIY